MRVYWVEEKTMPASGPCVEAKSADVTLSMGVMRTTNPNARLPNRQGTMAVDSSPVRTSPDEALTCYIIGKLRAVETAKMHLQRAESLLESARKLAEVGS